jgi:hypothetical protein
MGSSLGEGLRTRPTRPEVKGSIASKV